MFVTDPVEPLSNQLNQDPNPNLILWGLYKVAVGFNKLLVNSCKNLVVFRLVPRMLSNSLIMIVEWCMATCEYLLYL